MAKIEISLHVAAPAARCFDLARSVDAHVRSTAATGERAVGGKTSGLLALGDEVTWRARLFGVWQELTSEITAFERPVHFRDSMVRGAFARDATEKPNELLEGDAIETPAPQIRYARLIGA